MPLPVGREEKGKGQDLGKGLGDIINLYIIEFSGKVKE
jgi:hypothetical protein